MGIGRYKIVEQNGNEVFNGENSDFFHIVDGKVNISIPLNRIENGSYKLVVDTFFGSKKADNILRISGSWECEFPPRIWRSSCGKSEQAEFTRCTTLS